MVRQYSMLQQRHTPEIAAVVGQAGRSQSGLHI